MNLPNELGSSIQSHWGAPPGELYTDEQSGDIVLACLRFGHVVLMIQPPRGFGENPVAIYHDPDLPPSHHYLAAYRWLAEDFRADAIVHLGKHGTLEWLPGKGLGLSARVRAGRGARRPAAGLPVHRQRPGGGDPGQAARARGDRRPPGAADGPRRHLRRDGQARAAAGRVRHRGRARPGQAARAAGADLVPDRGRPPAPRPGRRRPARLGRIRRLRAAHRRLPVRGQGRRDPRRPAHPGRRPGGGGPGQPGPGHPARPPAVERPLGRPARPARRPRPHRRRATAPRADTDHYERVARDLVEAMAAAGWDATCASEVASRILPPRFHLRRPFRLLQFRVP